MDFIEQLLPLEGYTNILVIMDCLTKQAIFVPTHNTIDTQMLADVFILHMLSKHGIPSYVTLDQGPKFVSMFFRSLATTLQMRLHFTSGHHPEADSQSKRTNQTLEQYLHSYYNYQQDNWAKLLPLAEFAFNNALLASTGISPFFTNKGYHPRLQVRSLPNLASKSAKTYSNNLDVVLTNLKQMLTDSQVCYQTHADTCQATPPRIKVGDSVFVLAKSIRTMRPSKKLSERYLGPFKVTSKPSAHSYQIKFPQHLRAIHPVFHISQLKLTNSSKIPNCTNPPPPPIVVNGNLEYEILQVLDSKLNHCRKLPLLYYVCWAGYEGTSDKYLWLSTTELDHVGELIHNFYSQYPLKPGPIAPPIHH